MNVTWGILSKYRNELYGFSIIWIILFHGLELKKTVLPKALKFIEPFLKHGNCGVEIFLFLSGICLYFSLKKNQDIIYFFKKRVSRILGSFLLIDASYWLFTCVYQKQNVLEFLQNITFYSFWYGKNQMVWFIALIVLLYAFYPIIFRAIEKYNSIYALFISVMIIYGVCFLLGKNYPGWFLGVEIALTRVPVFLIGCYCGRMVYEDIEIKQIIKLLTLFFAFYGLTYFYQHPYSLVKYYRIPYLFIGPSLAIWGVILLDVIKSTKLNRTMCLWGGLSLELYLSHIVLRKIFVNSLLYGENYKLNYVWYIIVCCAGAFFISYFINKMNEKCRSLL